ncbi:hypothetical protein KSS87_010667 [Heliosperma pusillum]|nr:hypothetical protein KSS87_010667 [Heliosperma pusillum]
MNYTSPALPLAQQVRDSTANGARQVCEWSSRNSLLRLTICFALRDVGERARVLLTHIPLYRPDGTYCGPHRSSAIINQSISRSPYDHRITYQNYVSEKSSGRLLDLVQPPYCFLNPKALVLSGHDHDQCTVTHKTKHGPVEEHTVGTLSWQQGNWYPSFMLMSVSTNKSSLAPEVLVQLCFLPRQLFIYMWYIALFVITILALSFWPSYGIDIGHHCGHLMTNVKKLVYGGLFSSGSKEKNEDEDCEYEMMWDAEGGMHLVKKPRTRTSSVESKEINSVERGNAVMRTSRRQTISQDGDSAKVDSDGNPGSSAAILPRSTKSTAARVVHRVLRVLGIVSVIALVNVPLYMMLLFKDWIE